MAYVTTIKDEIDLNHLMLPTSLLYLQGESAHPHIFPLIVYPGTNGITPIAEITGVGRTFP